MPEHSRAETRCCRLRLLGRWQLVIDTECVELGHREERLTALLGLSGRSSRLHVAGVLWPESTDARALASLRRAVLHTQERSPGLLQVDRLTIGLGPDVDVDVDVVRRAAAATEDALAQGAGGALVKRLVGEELLPDWYDDWVLHERECLEQLRVKALERIARHALEAGDLALTVEAAQAASDIDPLLESAGELAIRAHLDRGDLGSARREFDRYRDAVRDELGAPPSRAILDLIEPVLSAGSSAPREAATASHQRARAPDVVAAAPAPAPVPVRTSTAIPAPRHEPAGSTGTRRAVVRLLGVAALVLAVALAVAGVGYEDGGGVSDSGGTPLSTLRVLRAEGAIRAGQMVVRPVDAAVGSAAFLVRTTLRPALVHFEVRGPAGAGVVRTLLVRSAPGRVLELDGLDPGRYRWLASSSVASTVSGRLRIPDQPAAEDAEGSLDAAGAASTVTEPASPESSTPSPSQSSATAPPAPSQQPHHSAPSDNSPEARPTGRPIDPGTVPETPVG
jgi:DNA-binding SARP family transcriptional activator